jgi:hypothetical protein
VGSTRIALGLLIHSVASCTRRGPGRPRPLAISSMSFTASRNGSPEFLANQSLSLNGTIVLLCTAPGWPVRPATFSRGPGRGRSVVVARRRGFSDFLTADSLPLRCHPFPILRWLLVSAFLISSDASLGPGRPSSWTKDENWCFKRDLHGQDAIWRGTSEQPRFGKRACCVGIADSPVSDLGYLPLHAMLLLYREPKKIFVFPSICYQN